MFVSRATRHDFSDVEELMKANEWDVPDLKKGTTFIARDGKVVGCIRLVEVVPNHLVVDDVLVDEARRGEGIGARLMEAAMNSRGGTLYLCCHEPNIAFYERFGFKQIPVDTIPEPISQHFAEDGSLNPPEGHGEHFFMTAR